MDFKYFRAAWDTPIEEAKRQYHKLVMEHHPDRGGSEEAMKRVNAEWDYLQKHNYNIHQAANGAVYTDEQQDVPDEVTQRFAKIVSTLIGMEGVGIEICGSFIWLSGETYPWKEQLKELGFRWSRKKRMWYLAPSKRHHRSSDWSMDQIRARHGSLVVAEAAGEREARLLLA